MITFVMFLVGCIVGFIVHKLFMDKTSVGFLRVDRSEPEEGPYLFLELHRGMEDILDKEYVRLKVKKEDLIPRK